MGDGLLLAEAKGVGGGGGGAQGDTGEQGDTGVQGDTFHYISPGNYTGAYVRIMDFPHET